MVCIFLQRTMRSIARIARGCVVFQVSIIFSFALTDNTKSDINEAAALATLAEVRFGKKAVVPFAVWLQKTIFPLAMAEAEEGDYQDEESEMYDEEYEGVTLTTTAEPVGFPPSAAALPVVVTQPNETTPAIFSHPDFGNLRVITDEKTGEPWFVAKDVCDALDIRTDTVRGILDADEVTATNPNSIGVHSGGRAPLIVSEPGLYSLILRSRKPEARQFKRWVTHDVLPAIRRHGLYATPTTVDAMLADPDTAIRLLTQLKEERAAKAEI